jgi:cytochrome c
MEIFDQYTIPPPESQLMLLRYLLVLMYAVHFPFVGMLIGATALSLAFNGRDRDIANSTFARISKDLMDMVISNRAAVPVLGMLPLLALWMIYGEWLSNSASPAFWLLPAGSVLIVLSFAPLMAYRATLLPEGSNSTSNFGLGVAGLMTLLLGTYIVIGTTTRFTDPERWHLDQNAFRWMLSFNIIWRYGVFLLSGVAITGCGLLFFFFNWPGRRPIEDAKYATFMKNFGAGVALAAALLIPAIVFFYVVTTPIVATSGSLFGLATAIAVVLFVAFVILYMTIISPRPRLGTLVFVLLLTVFTLSGVTDQLTLVNATQEHSTALLIEAEEIRAQIELEREAYRAQSMQVDVARGQEVFETICMTCHRMDERLVGPPLNEVLPNYAGNLEGLVSFIQKPERKNPDYPPMPSPGLPLADVRSVAAYLLGDTGGESAPETPEQH